MGGILRFFIAVILGAVIGLGGALFVLRKGEGLGAVHVAGWRTPVSAGSAAADPYTRAVVAARGLLALTRGEAVYYARETDAEGAPLREECVYQVAGEAMPGQWWSLTAYAPDRFLPQNDDAALSYGSAQAGGGAWRVTLAAERPAQGAWISTAAAGEGYSIMLRIYRPVESLLQDPLSLPAPAIERVSCAGAPS